jgi:hypothetical protein
MPKLEPLQQWNCDTCGEIIEKPEDGYLEWLDDRPEVDNAYGFRIVHHAPKSPRKSKGSDCYYPREKLSSSGPLKWFLGADGILRLSSFIDLGKEFNEIYEGPQVSDLREWTVIFRRLHLPFFEEARGYLPQARAGDYGEHNEYDFYAHDTLQEIIERYSDDSSN